MPACLKGKAKSQRTFTKSSNSSCFAFPHSERRCCHPKIGMANDRGASPCSPDLCQGSLREANIHQPVPPAPQPSSPMPGAPVNVLHLYLHGWTVRFPPTQYFIAPLLVKDVVFLPFPSPHQSCSAETDTYLLPTARAEPRLLTKPMPSSGSHALYTDHPACRVACAESSSYFYFYFYFYFFYYLYFIFIFFFPSPR